MAAESLIVTVTDGTTDYTFNKTSQEGAKSVFSYSGNTASDRKTIEVLHSVAAVGSKATDVHQLIVKHEAVDTDTERVSVSKVSLQIHVPKGDVITMTHVQNSVSMLMCLFNKNFMTGFALGETPSGDYNVTGPFNPDRD